MSIIVSVKYKPLFIAVLIIAGGLLFWKIGARGINEWDEARNGVNACEMYRNHDFLNLYYNGQPDTWKC